MKKELFFDWIIDLGFRSELSNNVKLCKQQRKESQKEVSKWINVSLTKIKQIENGKCKDINAILSYLGYLGNPISSQCNNQGNF